MCKFEPSRLRQKCSLHARRRADKTTSDRPQEVERRSAKNRTVHAGNKSLPNTFVVTPSPEAVPFLRGLISSGKKCACRQIEYSEECRIVSCEMMKKLRATSGICSPELFLIKQSFTSSGGFLRPLASGKQNSEVVPKEVFDCC